MPEVRLPDAPHRRHQQDRPRATRGHKEGFAMSDALAVQEGGDHYKSMAIQPVEFITANRLTFLEGCVVKRVCRHRRKNGAEDIRKAIHELELLLQLEYPSERS
jgi:hypothetical protein